MNLKACFEVRVRALRVIRLAQVVAHLAEHAAFSMPAGAGGAVGSSLKFWHRSSSGSGSGYALNTQADDPHAGAVTSLVLSPAGDAAATTGEEGELRIWGRRGSSSSSSSAQGAQHWSCRAVATYRGAVFALVGFTLCTSRSASESTFAGQPSCHACCWDSDAPPLHR